MHAKFEVSIFNRSRDIEVIPKNIKVGHVTPSRYPFNLILHFLVEPLAVNLPAKFEVSSFNRC